MKNNVLPVFQEYLHSKSPIKDEYIQHYAHWARKFLFIKPVGITIILNSGFKDNGELPMKRTSLKSGINDTKPAIKEV